MILCRQLLILFFFILLGFCMAKGKILDQHNSGFLSWLIVNVANPALILSGGIGTSMDRRELFKVALVAAGSLSASDRCFGDGSYASWGRPERNRNL